MSIRAHQQFASAAFGLALLSAPPLARAADTDLAKNEALVAKAADVVVLPAPTIFAPGVISGQGGAATPAFAPDGRSVYFDASHGGQSTIFVSRLVHGHWSRPLVAAFSGQWQDNDAAMAPDGSFLVFVSNRPAIAGGQLVDGGNLWRVDRRGDGWGAPWRLPDGVNRDVQTFSPSVAQDGSVYFIQPADGAFHIFRSQFQGGGYLPPVRQVVGDPNAHQKDPAVSPDESFVIFDTKAPDSKGPDRLVIAFRQGDHWGAPADLGGSVNDNDNPWGPWGAHLGPDGRTLYFNSFRAGAAGGPPAAEPGKPVRNIWRVSLPPRLAGPSGGAKAADAVVLPEPTIFAPGVISGPGNDGTPTFSPDGGTLYFHRFGARWAVVLESHRTHAGWSKPVVASFSGPSSAVQPAFSPDGGTLVYAGPRWLPAGPDTPRQRVSHLWSVTRTGSGWSVPQPLPDTINISSNMHNPSIAANGDIYFTAPRAARPGEDQTWALYRAAYRNGRYDRALPLSFSEGDPADANEPYIAPDESYLIFGSRGLRGPLGPKHLYIALRSGSSWGPAVRIRYIDDDWTPDDQEAEPQVSPDGKTLYFNSSRSAPIPPNRTRAQVLVDAARLEAWDNGASNVWATPLRPLLEALRRGHS
jgi:Tol biopolymer transport system component